jgi:hypothetical protein
MDVWVLMIVGQFEEPFLEAALRSVEWADGFAIVNTDPEGKNGQQNERIVRNIVPREKLKLERLWMSPGKFDFAKARNTALGLIPDDAAVLIVDADDVHYPHFQGLVRNAIAQGDTTLAAHYWHHAVYKNLWHSIPHRRIVFPRHGAGFSNSQGTVHEELRGRVIEPVFLDYRYHHYGYIKPAREVSKRWEFYRSLGAPIHDYDRDQPDHALDDWPRICKLYTGEHPPAVEPALNGLGDQSIWPVATPDVFPHDTHPARVGLVLLTWNDEDNLRGCLQSLDFTREPFGLLTVDNGSNDDSPSMVVRYGDLLERPDRSLTEALNIGFKDQMDAGYEYIGWIHPDHVFEYPDWLTELVAALDTHPEWAKVGCQEVVDAGSGLRAGNTQCFIVRRSALEQIGLFDEGYLACGGYEDWDMNRRLINGPGSVMIWPNAVVRHNAMSTRKRHDNEEAARRNAGYYQEKWGDTEPPC